MNLIESIQNLNAAQQEAVMYDGGPALIIAGAGSGKTRVITHKLALLIEQGYNPEKLYALTFTNKAAREMRERVVGMIDPSKAYQIKMGTFHSIFARLLRTYASLLGYNKDFSILDTSDSKSFVRKIVSDLKLEDKTYTTKRVLNRISSAKNNLVSPEMYASDKQLLHQDNADHFGAMHKIYAVYCARCQQNNAMDFDDLLFKFNVLLRDYPEVLSECQSNIDYLLIDEYQDTNLSQFTLIRKLVSHNGRIFAVGDDAQSIYAFRGANIDNILGFSSIFPSAKIFRLEQNYRSTQNIVNIANGLIAHNQRRIPKELYSLKEAGDLVELNEHDSAYSEADYVVRFISRNHLLDGIPYARQAVLYRTNAQSRILEDALRRASIPYTIYGGTSFYSRQEIKQAMAFVQVLVNPYNNEALIRTLSFPKKGIGEKTIEKLLLLASENNLSLYNVMESVAMGTFSHTFSTSVASKLKKHLETIATMANYSNNVENNSLPTLSGWIEYILRLSGVAQVYAQDSSVESQARLDNLKELVSGAGDFEEQYRQDYSNQDTATPLALNHLSLFVQSVSLLTDQDTQQQVDSVQLMTIHAAKGLEFESVIICGIEETILPSSMSLEQTAVEEERRLLYVAITRAEKICSLNYARMRRRNGRDELMLPSRFIRELDSKLLREKTTSSGIYYNALRQNLEIRQENTAINKKQESKFSGKKSYIGTYEKNTLEQFTVSHLSLPNGDFFSIGDQVEHKTFGKGVIQELFDDDCNSRVTVLFEDNVTRKLLLRFAHLKKEN